MTEIPRRGCPSIHQLFLFTQWSDHGKKGWILQTSAQQTLVRSFVLALPGLSVPNSVTTETHPDNPSSADHAA